MSPLTDTLLTMRTACVALLSFQVNGTSFLQHISLIGAETFRPNTVHTKRRAYPITFLRSASLSTLYISPPPPPFTTQEHPILLTLRCALISSPYILHYDLYPPSKQPLWPSCEIRGC